VTGTFGWATINQLTPNPLATFTASGGIPNPDTTLDFIGRNHGLATIGTVPGSNLPTWDQRTSNFLYVDGHVENKHVSQTVYPVSQWGSEFYSLPPH